MKKLMILMALIWATTTLMATETISVNPLEQCCKKHAVAKTTFKVSGNCGMCKATIEKAAKSVDGVVDAEWNKETKEITVNYDASKVKVEQIHKAIADSGYDTEKEKANDETYSKLHSCCKYRK